VKKAGLKVKRTVNKVVNGMKYCKGCMKMEKVEVFPDGSSSCLPSKQAIQNCRNAARAQGELEWFTDLQNDPDKKEFQKLIANYKVRATLSGSAKSLGVFPILQYKEENRRERVVMDEIRT
jgi:hypothetical protein